MTKQSISNPYYKIQHAFDSINTEVASKVLKLECFTESKKRFDWDFINDIGIINLLRIDYIESNRIDHVFRLYQSTRIDDYSHRYESLFVTLILAIIGDVISGIILGIYQDSKEKITSWLKKGNRYSRKGSSEDIEKVLLDIKNKDHSKNAIEKYYSKRLEKEKDDLRKLIQCYIARMMVDDMIISKPEYDILVNKFIRDKECKTTGKCLEKYYNYERSYYLRNNSIKLDKVLLTIDGYSKGILKQRLEENDIELKIAPEHKTDEYYHGLPASAGFAIGYAWVVTDNLPPQKSEIIPIIKGDHFNQNDIDKIRDCGAIVVTNCGLTGHIPLICRGWRKGCVILSEEDCKNIRNGDHIAVSGHQGLVVKGDSLML